MGGKIAFNPEALAFTEEPGSVDAYVGQLRRWFSWRPVFEKHKGKLSNGLKVLVSWMLAESVGYLFWLGVMLYLFFSGRFVLALIMFLADLVLVSMISLYQCRRIGFPVSKVLASIPYYYALRIPTALVFWGSFIFPKRNGW